MMNERLKKLTVPKMKKAKIISYGNGGLGDTGTHGRYQSYNFSLEVWNEYKSLYKIQEGMKVSLS